MRFFTMRSFSALIVALLLPISAFADSDSDQRAALQMQLDQLNIQIQSNQSQLDGLQQQRTSLERDVAILDAKIKDAQLGIKARDLTIRQIKAGINDKERGIFSLDTKVASGQESVAQMLRETRMIDDLSLVEIALGGNLQDLMQEIDDFGAIQRSLDASFTQMATARADLAARKQALEDQQQEEQDLLEVQVLQQQGLKKNEIEKKNLVTTAKGQESVYQNIIASQKKSKAQIEEALFGLRDTGAIQFGTAYNYAKEASQGTGVRAAVILAILTQESDLGKNVGSCLVNNILSGTGLSKSSGRLITNVMKAPRDTQPFQTITDALGLVWSNTPVSCPQGGNGYGGAMGPAQFIPSTWMLYKDRLTRLTGDPFPNPWSARTAIFATAMLMADNGADGGTAASERKAALKYFAGGNWNKAANAFYGTSVMDLASDIQQQIDVIGG